jgi:sec-independent protein translocase protein TatA
MQMPGMSEWLIILLVVVLLFGGKKIPELMRGLGKGVREFKNASNETDEVKKEINEVASDLNKKCLIKRSAETVN